VLLVLLAWPVLLVLLVLLAWLVSPESQWPQAPPQMAL